jgi:hypothetical protein
LVGWVSTGDVGQDIFPIGSIWNCYVNPQIISFDSIVEEQDDYIDFALVNWLKKDFQSIQIQLEKDTLIGIIVLSIGCGMFFLSLCILFWLFCKG